MLIVFSTVFKHALKLLVANLSFFYCVFLIYIYIYIDIDIYIYIDIYIQVKSSKSRADGKNTN